MTAEQDAWPAVDLVGGAPFLDFTNTVGGRTKSRELDRLTSYSALVAWAQAAAIVAPGEAERLLAVARADGAAAERRLQDARLFRESLYGLLSRAIARGEPAGPELEKVNGAIATAAAAARLVWAEDRLVWWASLEDVGLDVILYRVALSALRFLDGEALDRLRECERCSWLFLDRSKNGRRRWCRMDACGNRAKAARHYRKNN
jgi:predicted RNA-binding Zn ribbon-like protein